MSAGCGADAVVLTCPGYFNYNQQETESIFLNFADNSPLPVMICDIPVYRISGIEYSTGAVEFAWDEK